MPSSRRRSLRDIRRSYTGEDSKAAKAGLGRGDLGFARCSPAQRRLRAALAVHLFNDGFPQSTFARAGLHSVATFLAYTMTVSPRYDDLVCIVPHALENAVGRLMSMTGDGTPRFPGLRLAAVANFEAYHIVDLVTGGRLTLATQSAYPSIDEVRRRAPGRDRSRLRKWPGIDIALFPAERLARAAVPAMSVEIETLLAALVARLSIEHPAGRWSLGLWFTDPLRRPLPAGFSHDGRMSLWESGHRWELRWCEHPRPEDIVGCLTDFEVGLPGASAVQFSAYEWEIRLGSAVLTLRYGVSGDADD